MSAVNTYPSQPHDAPGSDARPGEPSMEDILASIRRIIADDQSRQTPPFRRPQAALPRIDGPDDIQSARDETAETVPVASLDVVPPVPETTVERAAAAMPHLNTPAAPEPLYTVDQAAIDAIAHAGAAAVLRPTFGQGPAQASASLAEPVARAPEPPRPPTPPPAPAQEPPSSSLDVDTEPLVSPVTAAGIESSFQALATTVLMQNTAAVESMVRDALRPMLKTWLDDNLPTIVERLVRVEIERVARGGRG